MKNRVTYELILKREYYTTEYILMWINEVTKIIQPERMQISTIGSRFKKYNAEILRDEIESEAAKTGIDLHLTANKEYFSTCVKEEDDRVIVGVRIAEENQGIEQLLEDAMCRGYGVSAYKHSSDDIFEQNLKDVALYKLHIGDTEGKRITHSQIMPRKEIIDIEYNPGHEHLEAGIYFGAYHCMWFGRDFYKYISKEKLKAFSNCFKNVELENEVICIKLYENMWDYENPVNRNRQWDFRKSIGIDEVAHSLHGRQKPKVTDPVLEILPKDENGNEVTRFYFTRRGKNVRKSQADVERTYTHTPDGKLLHVEHRELKNEDSKDDMD